MSLDQDIQQKSFRSEHQKALLNVMYTHNCVITHLNTFFKGHDVTRQQYNVLRILRGHHPEPATIQLIRDRMLDKMSDASRIVERLRVKQFIERKVSDADKRTVKVTITEAGLRLLDSIDPYLDEIERPVKNLSDDEAAQLNQLLDKIRI